MAASSLIGARSFAPARTGASFTAVTVMLETRARLVWTPSLATTLTERSLVVGASLVLLYSMPCKIV